MYAQPAFRMENPAEMAAFIAVRRLATPFIAGGLDGFLPPPTMPHANSRPK